MQFSSIKTNTTSVLLSRKKEIESSSSLGIFRGSSGKLEVKKIGRASEFYILNLKSHASKHQPQIKQTQDPQVIEGRVRKKKGISKRGRAPPKTEGRTKNSLERNLKPQTSERRATKKITQNPKTRACHVEAFTGLSGQKMPEHLYDLSRASNLANTAVSKAWPSLDFTAINS